MLARVILAAAVGDPIWPAVTHPIMAAVWAGIASDPFINEWSGGA
jgi:hypothetical protein